MTPTRFSNGVTNATATAPMAMLPILDPSVMHVFFDDFDKFTAADWTITTAETGIGDASEAIADADGGVLVITNDDADDDHDFLQFGSETFSVTAGKKLFFKARLKVSDATDSDFVMGLQITDTSPLDTTDGIFFQKDDGDTNLDFHVEKDDTATSETAIHTMADDTYVELAFAYDGSSEIAVYVDGAKVATITTLTNLPDDEVLTVSFGIQNGAAAVKTMSVDYVLVAKER